MPFRCWSSRRLGARRVFVWSSWLTAISGLLFALFARSYVSGLVLYTVVAIANGGTYTTAIMLLALSLVLSRAALPWGGYPA
jgi:hypothetical protein